MESMNRIYLIGTDPKIRYVLTIPSHLQELDFQGVRAIRNPRPLHNMEEPEFFTIPLKLLKTVVTTSQ